MNQRHRLEFSRSLDVRFREIDRWHLVPCLARIISTVKTATKRVQAGQETEAELRELREIEKRVLAGTEPLVSGEDVVRETMRELARDAKRRRRG
jgi:hypothetical protein